MEKPSFTGDQELVRKLNKSIVFNYIKDHGPVSRAEIARQTSLNKATVSSLVDELLSDKFVNEIGQGESSGGRRPVLLLLNNNACSVIGVDLGVNFILVILTNLHSQILWSKKIFFTAQESFDSVINMLVALVNEAIHNAPSTPHGILGVGVAIPGIIDSDKGFVLLAPNLNWKNVDLKSIIEEKVGLPTVIDNDANMAVLGEKMFGKAIGYNHVVYVSAGIGIGVGLILNNEIYRGSTGFAGEMGHMIIERNGLKCSCGNRGCWEMYASEKAFYLKLMSLDPQVTADIPFQELLKRAYQGDQQIIATLNETGVSLGIGIANIVNTFNPELVVIGNTLAEAHNWILNPVKKVMLSRALKQSSKNIHIVQSDLGDKACAIGTVSRIIGHLFSFSNPFFK